MSQAVRAVWAAVLALGLAACASSSSAPPADLDTEAADYAPRVLPAHLSLFGGAWLLIDHLPFALAEDEVPAVSVGAHACLLAERLSATSVRCYAQGSAHSGAATLTLKTAAHSLVVPSALTFDPASSLVTRVAVLGGALGAGWRDGSLSLSSQQNGFAALIARQLGAELPQALMRVTGFPEEATSADVDTDTGLLDPARQAGKLEALMTAGAVALGYRLDTALVPSNLALPGLVGEDGPLSDVTNRIESAFLAEALRGPAESVCGTAALLRELAPSLVIVGPEWGETVPEAGSDASGAFYEARLAPLFEATHDAVLLIATTPERDFRPDVAFSAWRRYTAIWMNNALYAQVAAANFATAEPRVVLADVYGAAMEALAASGSVTIGGAIFQAEAAEGQTLFRLADTNGTRQTLGFGRLRGLFSLDGQGLSDTGQALVANLMLRALDDALGPASAHPAFDSVPLVDVAAVLAHDELAPGLLEAAGLSAAAYPPKRIPAFDAAERCAILWRGGTAPDGVECPTALVSADGNALTLQAGEVRRLVLTPYTARGTVVGSVRVAAFASAGSFIGAEEAATSATSGAEFLYQAPDSAGDVELAFACGRQVRKIHLVIDSSAKGSLR